MEKHEVEQRFYDECAELLCVPSTYRKFPYSRRTRWNNRGAGNGRFEGFGIIRMYGPNFVHMALNRPVSVNKSFTSRQAALDYLRDAIVDSGLPL